MSEHLDVNSGETYTISAGETEEWTRAEIDGTLEVNGTLELIDDADRPTTDGEGFDVGSSPIDLPTAPLTIETMQQGIAIFLIGIMATLLAGAAFLRNYAAGILWSFGVVALLASGLFGIGLELFWVITIATVLTLGAGMVVRWMQ